MKRPAWLRKGLWIPVLVLVLGLAAVGAARLYLSSDHAARQVAERLQTMLGGRVEVHGSHIGLLGDSTLQGIEAYEDGDESIRWLQIDGARTDASALSLIRGASPEHIRLEGARIALRFNSAGQLLTRLPKRTGPLPQIPRLNIDQGELTLDQEGKLPMIIHGINVEIVPGEDGLTLTGTITDPFWGNWTARGDIDPGGGQGSVTLDTPGVDVTMEKLKAIAFVPPKVWQQVRVEGTTPVQVWLEMRTAGAKPEVHYRVEVSPRDARVRVPSIDLNAEQASGKAIIADQRVQLEDVKGRIAQGAITTNGDLNFRAEPTEMTFKVGVRGVILRSLPRSWHVPPRIDGQLTGTADLKVTVRQGKVQTRGTGKGVIDQLRLGKLGPKKPIPLYLLSDGRGFHFRLSPFPIMAPAAQTDLPARLPNLAAYGAGLAR